MTLTAAPLNMPAGIGTARRNLTLAQKFAIAFLSLVTAVLVINGAINMWITNRDARTQAVRVQQEKADAAAERVTQFMAEIEQQLGWTTRAEWARVNVEQRRYDFIRLLRQAAAITELVHVDGTGREQLKLSRLEPDLVASNVDYSADPRFVATQRDKVYYGPVTFRRGSEPYMTIGLAHAGSRPGVTIADVNLKLAWDVVTSIRVGNTGYAYITDPAGRLIAHPDMSLVLRNTDLTTLPQVAAVIRPVAGAAPMASGRAQDGREVLSANSKIAKVGWNIFVELPAAEALGPVWAAFYQTLALLALGVGLAGAAGTLLARRMVVPITELQAGAQKLGEGDLAQRITVRSGDEIGALAGQFNLMAGRIQEAQETLEQKVEDRTTEVQQALEYQKATGDVLSAIARSASETQPVFDTIVTSAARLCGAQFSNITLFDGKLLHIAALNNMNEAVLAQFRARYPMRPDRTQINGRVILDKAVVRVVDILSDPDYPAQMAKAGGWRSMLGVPLLSQGKAIGAIVMAKAEVAPYSERQVRLIQTFASQAVIAIENARLFNETKEALEQQTATADILKVISQSAFDLPTVLDTLISSASVLCVADQGIIFLRDRDLFRAHSVYPENPAFLKFMQDRPRRLGDKTIAPRVARSGKVEHIPDKLLDPDYESTPGATNFSDTRTMLGVPLLREGKVAGVFVLMRVQQRAFTQRQIELTQTFADQAAIAIENVRLFNETKEALERQNATAEVLQVISSSVADIQPVFDVIAERSSRLTQAEYGWVFLLRDGMIHAASSFGVDKAGVAAARKAFPIPLSRGSVTGRAITDGAVVRISDIYDDPEIDDKLKLLAKVAGNRANLSVPMRHNGRVMGAITVQRSTVGDFAEKEVDVLETFADQAVIAIENARLFEEVQARTKELQESLEYQTATSEVLGVISSSPNELQPVLEAIVASAQRLCNSEDAIIYVRDGDVVISLAHVGPLPWWPDLRQPLNRSWVTGRAVLDGKTVHVPDFEATDEFPEGRAMTRRTGAGNRAALASPLMRDGVAIGAILMRRLEPRPFTERQIQLLESFADQAVIAMNNVRLFNETKEALEQQTATAEVLQVISKSVAVTHPVFDKILDSCERLFATGQMGIFRVRDDGQVHISVWRGEALETVARTFPKPVEQSGTGLVIATRHTLHIPDVAAAVDAPPAVREVFDRIGNFSVAWAPMLWESRGVGSISVMRQPPSPFSEKELALLETFADQAVIAINNTQLFDEVQARTKEVTEALEYQTATSEVLGVISKSPSQVEPVFDAIVATARRLCGAEYALIVKRSALGTLPLVAHSGATAEFVEWLQTNPASVGDGTAVGIVAHEKRTLHLPDALVDPRFTDLRRQARSKARTMLGVPLFNAGEVTGVIFLAHTVVKPFTDRQIDLVTTFANQAVIAINNVGNFEQVQARTAELTQSLEDLRAAQDRLVQTEKLASLGQLTAGVAHEIKNPLNFVNNFADLSVELVTEIEDAVASAGTSLDPKIRAEMEEIAAMLKGNLAKVVHHGRRADSIVKNMLAHSRESGGERRAIDLNATVEEALNLAYHGARAEKPGFNITLERDFDATIGQTEVFPQEFTRVMLNLIGNGFHAANKKRLDGAAPNFEPVLRVTTKALTGKIVIKVRDNGTGIPDAVKARIFEPFFTTKPTGEGTGLGLSLSHDIVVKQHGGSLSVTTEPGRFTEFTITLPRKAILQEQSL